MPHDEKDARHVEVKGKSNISRPNAVAILNIRAYIPGSYNSVTMEADFPGNNMFFVTFVIAQAIGHHHNSALATFAGVQKCAGDILILKSYTVDDKLYASVERGDWPIIRMVTRDYLRILL